MDQALLLDVCVALATALCVALLIYGAWLCLPELNRTPSKESQEDETESEAVIRQPRPRIRAGTSGR
jgi:hypothetical protein